MKGRGRAPVSGAVRGHAGGGRWAGRRGTVRAVSTSSREPGPPPRFDTVPAMHSDPGRLRFARHEQLLARWPVADEAWARTIESRRLASVDRTPGPATFGR